MKPRLRRMGGIWYCAIDGIAGYGITPNEAWVDWHTRAFLEWSRRWSLMMGPAAGGVQ